MPLSFRLPPPFLPSFMSFCIAGMQGLMHTRQVFHHHVTPKPQKSVSESLEAEKFKMKVLVGLESAWKLVPVALEDYSRGQRRGHPSPSV